MKMFSLLRGAALLAFSTVTLAACGSQANAPSATSSPTATATPTPTPTATPTATPSTAAPVVMAQTVGTMGTLIVAASNGHTLYTFNSDSAGVSRCIGQCIAIWPALTVPAGQTPSGGPGVTGPLGTITRSDGSLQVTYKGLPLYFFHSDSQPGQTNGNYTGWSLVRP